MKLWAAGAGRSTHKGQIADDGCAARIWVPGRPWATLRQATLTKSVYPVTLRLDATPLKPGIKFLAYVPDLAAYL